MAFLHCEIFSNTLDMATAVKVILPNEGDLGQAPVLMLLHGLSDNSSGWSRYTAVEQYAREIGLAVIMPEVQRSFYTDMAHGLPYFSYISTELPGICRRMFGLSNSRGLNYIAGLSMGGYGALKCAFTFPDRYIGCGSFSGVADFRKRVRNADGNKEFDAILGEEHTVSDSQDLFSLAEKVQDPPRIYLSCGEQDHLWPDNAAFEKHLTALGIPHRFDHRDGDHNWRFWDRSLQDCLAYFFDKGSEDA